MLRQCLTFTSLAVVLASGALAQQAVVVHGLMRAVEAAHADVDDTRGDQVAVVVRRRQPVAPVPERLRVKRPRFSRQAGLRSRD